MADVLKRHISQCPMHPLSKLLGACNAFSGFIDTLIEEQRVPRAISLSDLVLKQMKRICDDAITSATA
jgi:hypothetical protein